MMILFRFFLLPIVPLFLLLRFMRQLFYRWGWFSVHAVATPVLSVGNITVGGTGKTPLILFLLEYLNKKQIKSAVIYRGYKSSLTRGFEKLRSTDPVKYGDEASLVFEKFSGTPVYVSPNRFLAAKEIDSNNEADLILLDDAFQHLSLKRNLDIVVLDVTKDLFEYLPLPLGNGRESWSALQRAQAVVLSKWNLTSKKLQSTYENKLQSFSHLKVLKFSYKIKSLNKFSGDTVTLEGSENICLCSGIGNPKSFEVLVQQHLNVGQKLKHFVFTDHFSYSDENVDKFAMAMKKFEFILITEKDAVKWRRLPEDLKEKVLIVILDYELVGNLDEVFQIPFTKGS